MSTFIGNSTRMLFFFNDTATTEIYTLSLHDALPTWSRGPTGSTPRRRATAGTGSCARPARSEEHTSELQSRRDIVCRLLLEKKKVQSFANYEIHFNCWIHDRCNFITDGRQSRWRCLR